MNERLNQLIKEKEARDTHLNAQIKQEVLNLIKPHLAEYEWKISFEPRECFESRLCNIRDFRFEFPYGYNNFKPFGVCLSVVPSLGAHGKTTFYTAHKLSEGALLTIHGRYSDINFLHISDFQEVVDKFGLRFNRDLQERFREAIDTIDALVTAMEK